MTPPDKVVEVFKAAFKKAGARAISPQNPLLRADDADTVPSIINFPIFAQKFKNLWFLPPANNIGKLDRIRGSFFFLLWKNLSVTNVSVNELVCLIRQFSFYSGSQIQPKNVSLISTADFTSFFENLLHSLLPDATLKTNGKPKTRSGLLVEIDKIAEFFAENYCSMLADIILFDHFFTSAIAHVPVTLEVNLTQIVGLSGYIHSAGIAIYTRNIEKASDSELLNQIEDFLELEKPRKFYAVPFANELFKKGERDHPAISLRNGLDGVRFHLRKHMLGSTSLASFVSFLPTYTSHRILVPKGLGAYYDERSQSKRAGADPYCTIWFVTDYSAHESDTPGYFIRGTKQYFFAFAQLLYNPSQFILFKERKPGWVAPITMPHTLSASLVNIARTHWLLAKTGRRPIIIDPFCGTGTTLIDAKIRFPEAAVIGLDRDPLAYSLCAKNLRFFSSQASDLEHFGQRYSTHQYQRGEFSVQIDRFMETRDAASMAPHEDQADLMLLVLTCFLLDHIYPKQGESNIEASVTQIQSPSFSRAVQARLDAGFSDDFARSFLTRFGYDQQTLCLLIWRAIATQHFSVTNSGDLFEIICSELRRFGDELKELRRVLSGTVLCDENAIRVVSEAFSKATIIRPDKLREIGDKTIELSEADVLKGLQAGDLGAGIYIARVGDSLETLRKIRSRCDLVVTDPPYGFNVGLEEGSLAAMYARFFGEAVRSLAPGGQLIAALPDFARNGRQVPFYQGRLTVTQQVMAAAYDTGRPLIHFAHSVPNSSKLFRPPYYWASTSGVSRSILHFTVSMGV